MSAPRLNIDSLVAWKKEQDAASRQLASHVQPPLWTAAPGRWYWSDGCAVTVEHIHGEYNATTLYHPSRTHRASDEHPFRELQVTP